MNSLYETCALDMYDQTIVSQVPVFGQEAFYFSMPAELVRNMGEVSLLDLQFIHHMDSLVEVIVRDMLFFSKCI